VTPSDNDADGNLTGDGTNAYTWDARNHLARIAQGKTASASFVYDAFGRRMEKTIGAVTTQFLYDRLNPVQELNGASPPAASANLLTGLGVDEYFARTDSNGAMAFLRDALGSTIGLVNSAGSIDTSYAYEPFGDTTTSGPSSNSYQFTGRENDGAGLYFYRARYYSPSFQRFIAQDPIGFAGGDANLYGYALNNPVSFRDPSGRFVPLIVLAAGGVLGGGAAAYSNYGAYESGAITGGQYAEAIAFGAATGVLTSIPGGIFGSALAGALGAGANSLVDQRLANPCGSLNWGAAGESAGIGAIGGSIAAGLGKLGDEIISLNPSIGQEIPEREFQSGYPTPGYTTYGTGGAIAGGAIGTGIRIIYGP
jgi:RHS repeat-associated protein